MLPDSGEQTPNSARGKRKEKSKKRDVLDRDELDPAQHTHTDEELDNADERYHDSVEYGSGEGPTDFMYQNRSYDDEDEALQAALKASMADIPAGFEMPELKPLRPPPVKKVSQQKDSEVASSGAPPVPEPPRRWRPAEEAHQDAPTSSVTEEDDEDPVQELSPGMLFLHVDLADGIEQIRLARLARFQQESKAREEAEARPVDRGE